jgi:hypothetical protein
MVKCSSIECYAFDPIIPVVKVSGIALKILRTPLTENT